jgi:hypothetical protein
VTIFDYLKDILVTKKGDLVLDEYTPFLVNRWLSFINPTVAGTLNHFNTKAFLENKELHYKTMLSLFPKTKTIPKITYLKKVKEQKTESNEYKDASENMLSYNLELSKREIRNLQSLVNELS